MASDLRTGLLNPLVRTMGKTAHVRFDAVRVALTVGAAMNLVFLVWLVRTAWHLNTTRESAELPGNTLPLLDETRSPQQSLSWDASPMEVSIKVTDALADDLFTYWRRRVSPFQEKILLGGRLIEEDTGKLLREVGQEYRCIVRVSFTPPSVRNQTSYFSISRNQSHCEIGRFAWQADVLEFALSAVVRENLEVFKRPFRFYFDMSDGTRDDYLSVFYRLGLPLLSSCVGANNKEAMPFPDFHSLIGIYSADSKQNGNPPFPASALSFVDRFASIYRGVEPSYDWDTKVRKAVYRGACIGTIDPDARDWTVVPLRQQLCDKWKLSELMDIGFTPLNVDEDFHFDFQQHLHLTRNCKVCETVEGTVLDRSSMVSRYRFQIAVDGVGYSFDSTVWKMLSNSTVYFLRPDTRATNLYHAWWYPALQAYHNYIPSTVSELESKINWCIAQENEEVCRQIAKNARYLMEVGVNPSNTRHYMFRVLQYLHDQQ